MYDIVFPLWYLLMFPNTWIFVLPIMYIIDSVVFLCVLKILDVENIKEMYKKSILKIWGIGFLADMVGTVLIFTTQILPDGVLTSLSESLITDPFGSIWSFCYLLVSFAISACLIYFLNCRFSLKNFDLEKKVKVKIALFLAIFTAPYFFFYPTDSATYLSKVNNFSYVDYNYNDEHEIKNEQVICEYIDLGEL